MLKVVEAFSGIGSQVEALKNIKIDHSIAATIEWEVSALYAYDIIHNGKQDLKDYRVHTKESMIEKLAEYNLSSSGKDLLTKRSLRSMTMIQLKSILAAIERTNNLIDVTSIKAEELPDDIDVLTYSFPCQDLSISSFWHNNLTGIDKNAGNRSGLLWQVERLLKEYCNIDKKLPKFLLMENVSAILSKRHIGNFRLWQEFLENIGYVNQVYTLNSNNFNVPQDRERTFMISVLYEDQDSKHKIEDYFFENNLENYSIEKTNYIGDYLRLNYDIEKYRNEGIESTPNYTPSRVKIFNSNRKLAFDRTPNNLINTATLTTKQDRNPNSGIIVMENEKLKEGAAYRNLTPRECFLLMGFKEEEYDLLMEHNLKATGGKKFLNAAKLYRLTGNSIVVPILEKIFEQIDHINENILLNNNLTEEVKS